MTIEIDDSGTGDLIGDAFIGFFRKETGELIFKNIPVEMFNEVNWQERMPFKVVVDLVKAGLQELNFQKEKEKIEICRGNIFDLVRNYFDEAGINYTSVSIEGNLQHAVEEKLINHLRQLGVKSKSLTIKSGAKRFFVLFNWLCQDFNNREKYVKTGFPAWKKTWKEEAIKKYNKNKVSKLKKQ